MTDVSTTTASEVRGRVEALFRALNEHDLDKLIAMHTPDAVWEDPNLETPVRGRAAIAMEAAAFFRAFPDLQYLLDELEVYVTESGRAAARWHAVGTMTGPIDPPGLAPTGKRASVSGVCLYEFNDGLLARHTIVFDRLGMLQQVGILPRLGTAPARFSAALQRLAVLAAKTGRRR